MAGRQIVPLMEMGSRAPEAGRIRLGVQTKTKSGKMRPTSIDTFRFESLEFFFGMAKVIQIEVAA